MKKVMLSTLLAIGSLFTFAMSPALADDNACVFPGKIQTPAQIQTAAQSMGFTIKNVKLDDCVYKVKVKDQNDKKWELYFDPNTGKFIGKKMED